MYLFLGTAIALGMSGKDNGMDSSNGRMRIVRKRREIVARTLGISLPEDATRYIFSGEMASHKKPALQECGTSGDGGCEKVAGD